MKSRWYHNPRLPRDGGWGGWYGSVADIPLSFRILRESTSFRCLQPIVDDALSHVGKGIVVVQDPEREAFRAGFLAVWNPPGGGLSGGWTFDGLAAADREAEAWAAWARPNTNPIRRVE